MDISLKAVAWVVVVLLVLFWIHQNFRNADDGEDGETPKKKFSKRGPDMAFSAGRDAAQKNARSLQVFIPVEPHEEAVARHFYLDVLGLTEMRAPNYPKDADGFWAVSGSRQIYFGTCPSFSFDATALPAFPVKNIEAVAARLTDEGYKVTWNNDIAYVKRLVVVDPTGMEIGLIDG